MNHNSLISLNIFIGQTLRVHAGNVVSVHIPSFSQSLNSLQQRAIFFDTGIIEEGFAQ